MDTVNENSNSQVKGLRAALRGSDAVFNAFFSIPDPGLAGILGSAGYDYVVLDVEHGPFTLASIRNCVDAVAATPAWTVARLPSADATLIKQTLDAGVDGVQIAMVHDAEIAAAAVRAARYAPEGARGYGAGHAAGYGSRFDAYVAEANSQVAVVAMIESSDGVENAAAIAAVEGLDAIFVGPTDLSASLGFFGQSEHPVVQEAIAHVVEASLSAGIRVGVGCSASEVAHFAKLGMSVFACYFDGSAIASGARRSLAEATAGSQGQAPVEPPGGSAYSAAS